MSAKAFQTEIDRLGIEEGDTIRNGRTDFWTVERVKNSRIVDCNLVVQSNTGDWSNVDPDHVSQCECGQYTLSGAVCFDCSKGREEE
jgi:hypothetical protein